MSRNKFRPLILAVAFAVVLVGWSSGCPGPDCYFDQHYHPGSRSISWRQPATLSNQSPSLEIRRQYTNWSMMVMAF